MSYAVIIRTVVSIIMACLGGGLLGTLIYYLCHRKRSRPHQAIYDVSRDPRLPPSPPPSIRRLHRPFPRTLRRNFPKKKTSNNSYSLQEEPINIIPDPIPGNSTNINYSHEEEAINRIPDPIPGTSTNINYNSEEPISRILDPIPGTSTNANYSAEQESINILSDLVPCTSTSIYYSTDQESTNVLSDSNPCTYARLETILHTSRIARESRYKSESSSSFMSGEMRRRKKKADACPICFSPLTSALKALPCTHIFHEKCIHQWLSINAHCPLCRYTTS